MKDIIKKTLGWIGFRYCKDCGNDLICETHGYYGYERRRCPHCDNLERFDISVKEHITTIVPDDKIPQEYPPLFQTDRERLEFCVGCGFVMAVIIFALYLILK